MKFVKRITCIAILGLLASVSLKAQSASGRVQALFEKYADIPNYKVDITYESVNERMGFSNTQTGVLVVKGERYILKYGPNETWLNDGKTEYVGTKEEDHSQIMYFCPGKNAEAIVDYGALLTFYASDHAGNIEGDVLKLKPSSEMPYVELHIETEGNNILSITAIDDFGTSHKYTISNFTTNTSGTKFVINPAEYAEKIYEQDGCKK